MSNPFDWRAHLAVHPAAELFPLMPEAELKELAEDIRTNGLFDDVTTWKSGEEEDQFLLDGRNRLDALALLGLLYEADGYLCLKTWTGEKWADLSGDVIHFRHSVGGDPYILALSLNVHRRHLTAEQKNELIDKLIKADPEKSNRRIAEQAKVGHPTVARRRGQLEEKGDVERRSTSIDTKGRRQPATRPGSKPKAETETKTVAESTEASAEKRKAEHAAADTPPTDTKVETGKPERRGSARDTALCEFDGHVLRLLQMTNKARPGRFALRTGVSATDLRQLAGFLTEVASERPAGLMKAEEAAA
jgi:hypothetical protein